MAETPELAQRALPAARGDFPCLAHRTWNMEEQFDSRDAGAGEALVAAAPAICSRAPAARGDGVATTDIERARRARLRGDFPCLAHRTWNMGAPLDGRDAGAGEARVAGCLHYQARQAGAPARQFSVLGTPNLKQEGFA